MLICITNTLMWIINFSNLIYLFLKLKMFPSKRKSIILSICYNLIQSAVRVVRCWNKKIINESVKS